MPRPPVSKAATSASLRTILARRLYERMNGAGWFEFDDVLHDLGRLIPPGVAKRRAEKDLVDARRRTGVETDRPRHRRMEVEQIIASGRRTMVREFLRSCKASIEREGDKYHMVKPPQQVRSDQIRAEVLRPPFNALVSTYNAHNDAFAVEQVRLMAHENGFHVRVCPPGCELLPGKVEP